MDDNIEVLGSYDDVAEELANETSVVDWVLDRRDQWRRHYESNYKADHQEYYRLWRGIWAEEDKENKSERSKIITPALQQAVESNVAEVEEATFGRGRWFDIKDDDPDKADVQLLKQKLEQKYEDTQVRSGMGEVLINAAVYGTGIAEVVVEHTTKQRPATRQVNSALKEFGVETTEVVEMKLRPVLPQNFLIDPVTTDIDEAMGCMFDEFVGRHSVEILQEQGVYEDAYVGTAAADEEIEADPELDVVPDDKIRLVKYFGLVPTEILAECELIKKEDLSDTLYHECVVVIGNDNVLLKCVLNPYMMNDRPVIAFPWDVVPGRFWGRGVCEKGYNSQKALDTEIRARIDALALTIHPMIGMNTREVPRGFKPEIRPGKVWLTTGTPTETIQPINMGDVSQITFAQAAALQQMVQQATGAVDSAGIAGQVNGEATAAGISMSLGAIIKRHKRTLINFQQGFLIPWVKKSAWRYMQFDAENFPSNDYNFIATSSLGIIAREYEVTQLTQLLQTMSPESPMYPALIESIVDNMNLANREDLIDLLRKANQPTPDQQAMAKAQMDFQQSQTNALNAEAEKSQAQAQKALEEAKYLGVEAQADLIQAAIEDLDDDGEQKDFERRMTEVKQLFDMRKHKDEMKLRGIELLTQQRGQVTNDDPARNEQNIAGN